MNLKLAFRRLFKTPFVSIVAITSLALGIGANAAIFSLFDQTLLRPLPVARPGELVNLSAPGPKPGSQSCGQAGDCEDVFSYPMFRDLEKQQTVFTGIAAHVSFGVNLAYRGQTMNGGGMLVSGSYFPVLGVQPGARAPARPGRRSEYRGAFRDGPQPWILDDAAWREPGRPERHDHRQRPGDDDRRRGAAGASAARPSATSRRCSCRFRCADWWPRGGKASTTAGVTGRICSLA